MSAQGAGAGAGAGAGSEAGAGAAPGVTRTVYCFICGCDRPAGHDAGGVDCISRGGYHCGRCITTHNMDIDIEMQNFSIKRSNKIKYFDCFLKEAERFFILLLFTSLILLMMGRPLFCNDSDMVIWNYHGQHMSQHVFDPYSISHLLHGLIFYRVFIPFANKNLFLTIITACLWEIIENTPTIINIFRSDTINSGYYGDSLTNSISDILCCIIGWKISSFLPINYTIIFYLLGEILCFAWIGDNLIRNIFILTNILHLPFIIVTYFPVILTYIVNSWLFTSFINFMTFKLFFDFFKSKVKSQ